ncbi:MAG: hypothetical protein AB7E79_12990 [Rhodospirillaceae bacterium]
MDRRARILAQALAVTLIILAGLGVYAYALEDRLSATQESFTALEQDRNLWKSKAEEAAGVIDTASASLDQCSKQIETLRSRLVMKAPLLPDPRS